MKLLHKKTFSRDHQTSKRSHQIYSEIWLIQVTSDFMSKHQHHQELFIKRRQEAKLDERQAGVYDDIIVGLLTERGAALTKSNIDDNDLSKFVEDLLSF